MGVDLAAAALVDALFEEHGVLVRLVHGIGQDRDRLPSDSNAFGNLPHRNHTSDV